MLLTRFNPTFFAWSLLPLDIRTRVESFSARVPKGILPERRQHSRDRASMATSGLVVRGREPVTPAGAVKRSTERIAEVPGRGPHEPQPIVSTNRIAATIIGIVMRRISITVTNPLIDATTRCA